ncbi:MAG: hypothetical protein IMW93_09440 [Thermoanaerobacteraceae bacterium]|nr:hypothetical protein [Thermoanaerobacteraceae bacterium]
MTNTNCCPHCGRLIQYIRIMGKERACEVRPVLVGAPAPGQPVVAVVTLSGRFLPAVAEMPGRYPSPSTVLAFKLHECEAIFK